ncbi:MAG: serpin family protein [Candidatus Cloacimonetes bacterium]|nr:serpin family protein [Candidatus Cloacimonadota bacterium]
MKFSITLIALMLFLLLNCSNATNKDSDNYSDADWHASRIDYDLIKANTHFAADMLKQLISADSQNIFYSPLSLSIALSMCLNGARGSTLTEMQDVLHYQDFTLEKLNVMNQHFIRSLVDVDTQVELGLANSIWIVDGYPMLENYIATNEEYFFAEIFQDQPFNDETIAGINNWVNEKTEGRIPLLLRSLSDDDVMVLINAQYFYADWSVPFDPESTSEKPFKTDQNEYVTVPFMCSSGHDFTFRDEKDFRAARLPYGNGNMAMYVFAAADIDEFIMDMDVTEFNNLFAGFAAIPLEQQKGSLFAMPSFEISFSADYNKYFGALGMTKAFSTSADFSGMVAEPHHPWISKVAQVANITVNENGTTAAAVSYIFMTESISEGYEFILDRSFLYIIRDDRNGTILFMGILDDPSM